MSSGNLESLRRKVELGETLSEAELDALRAAAAGSSGATLWLTVAHALVNAGAEREALPLLERLRRDFPKDLQVRLGLARALLGLDRYGDAEVALREALALSPGDPEAIKVLAVLALRRGEKGRAQEYVRDVLERDPFDEEARLLKEELEAVELPPPAQPEEQVLRPEFNAALAAALRRAGVKFRLQGRNVLVKLESGELARVDVASLYGAYPGGRSGLTAYVEDLARQLGGMGTGLGGDATTLESRLRPVLRPAGFEAQAVGALHRPGPAGLEVFFVLEDAQYVRYLPVSALETAGLSTEAVEQAAWRNLEAAPAPVHPVVLDRGMVRLAEAFSGLWAVAEGDGHDGARLLTAEQRRRLVQQAGEGPLRVSLGHREFALVCREGDEAECEALAKVGHAPDGIPGLFRLTAEGLTRL
ncbi:tetratricopeptide repeat protein [Hyalangium rubrum]|uniref:Tetratricopeptide repeat protein n=1 Tax=Hyalangium rubrum TaxID=3103134 RepID=A0ABU5HGT0_9BACT|nr:tetratricopeptide repeat protein [Hyalangium sp. s54d21]MDY7232668.1 tetratricopeptide repeat protein [Hyalangium sp. s54d21]